MPPSLMPGLAEGEGLGSPGVLGVPEVLGVTGVLAGLGSPEDPTGLAAATCGAAVLG